MDELNELLEDNSCYERRGQKRNRKSRSERSSGKSCVQSIQSKDTWDEALDDSIAQSVKRRKRNTNNDKEFDSKYFYDSVVNQIEDKYKNSGKEDAIIDLNNLEIIDKKGFVEQRVRTEFGYFAENTLEELRKNSFRNKDLISCPLIASTPKTTKQTKTIKQSIASNKSLVKSVCKQQTNVKQNSKTVESKNTDNKVIKSSKQLMKTQVIIASNEESDEDSDEDSDYSNASEEMDENHPLVIYENQNMWTNNEYQIDCLKKTIEMLKTDRNGHFRDALKNRVLETGLPGLPSGPNITPIIKFNLKGEPNFEFFFSSPNSPIGVEQVLQMDYQIINLSQLIYDWIRLKATFKGNLSKRIAYSKRQIEFN